MADFDDDEDGQVTERLGYNTDRKLLTERKSSDGRVFEDGFDAEYPSMIDRSSSRDESLDKLIADRAVKAKELDQELSHYQ